MELKNYTIRVIGKVQGVGFRYSALQKAQELELRGYVRNERDGSVFLEIEGSSGAAMEMIHWCRKGPSFGRVDDISLEEGSPRDLPSFYIAR